MCTKTLLNCNMKRWFHTTKIFEALVHKERPQEFISYTNKLIKHASFYIVKLVFC